MARGGARRHREPRIWVREILSPGEARAEYPRLWEVAASLMAGLDDDQLSRVVSLVVDTCPLCYRGNRDCRCEAPPAP
jgi:hypothetical protein